MISPRNSQTETPSPCLKTRYQYPFGFFPFSAFLELQTNPSPVCFGMNWVLEGERPAQRAPGSCVSPEPERRRVTGAGHRECDEATPHLLRGFPAPPGPERDARRRRGEGLRGKGNGEVPTCNVSHHRPVWVPPA